MQLLGCLSPIPCQLYSLKCVIVLRTLKLRECERERPTQRKQREQVLVRMMEIDIEVKGGNEF